MTDEWVSNRLFQQQRKKIHTQQQEQKCGLFNDVRRATFVLRAIVKQKIILFDPSKVVEYFFLVECEMKPKRFTLCVTLFYSLASEKHCISTGCLWCQRRRQQTISIRILQLIIAIISINSILTWHLAWFCPFVHHLFGFLPCLSCVTYPMRQRCAKYIYLWEGFFRQPVK